MSFLRNTVQFFCRKVSLLLALAFLCKRFEFSTIEKPRVPEGSRKVLRGFPEGWLEGFSEICVFFLRQRVRIGGCLHAWLFFCVFLYDFHDQKVCIMMSFSKNAESRKAPGRKMGVSRKAGWKGN